MNIRLDPRRLSALKALAGEAGLRPGELVTKWVEERLDAARPGARPAIGVGADVLAAITARLDELTRRVDALTPSRAPEVAQPVAVEEPVTQEPAAEPAPRRAGRPRGMAAKAAEATPPVEKRRPGRPRKSPAPRKAAVPRGTPLHEEIAAVIAERGPQTASELAAAIIERGRSTAPRSGKPLDAATISARVSNPVYRSRFVRREGRIGLAVEPAE